MSAPESFEDLYTDELRDLWSANDQMARVLKKIAGKASDPGLKDMLTKSQEGIAQHNETVKEVLTAAGAKVSKEHCKGMEGLVAEATKHAIDEAPAKGPLRDAQIIAQYQRMSHYGIAAFGTAAAFAQALGREDDAKKLKALTDEIYGADEYASKLAEMNVNREAVDA